MDLLQKGKQFAKDGKYEEALDSLLLALENDKENPDIHFFLGLNYTNLDQPEYAKHHYETALKLDPGHQKTKLMISDVQHFDAKRPPERKLILKAISKSRKEQNEALSSADEDEKPVPTINLEPDPESSESESKAPEEVGGVPLTDDKWEKAFPLDAPPSSSSGGGLNWLWIVVGIAVVGTLVYFALNYFMPIES